MRYGYGVKVWREAAKSYVFLRWFLFFEEAIPGREIKLDNEPGLYICVAKDDEQGTIDVRPL